MAQAGTQRSGGSAHRKKQWHHVAVPCSQDPGAWSWALCQEEGPFPVLLKAFVVTLSGLPFNYILDKGLKMLVLYLVKCCSWDRGVPVVIQHHHHFQNAWAPLYIRLPSPAHLTGLLLFSSCIWGSFPCTMCWFSFIKQNPKHYAGASFS